jgi:pyruvate formate lyase activating enzyme
MLPLEKALDQHTKTGELYDSLEDKVVRCHACAHRCLILPGKRGICKTRFNQQGKLLVPTGYVVSAQTDPIEKKPLSHFLPGSDALTFGMMGCNFHCSFCQNWVSSQALNDGNSRMSASQIQSISAEELVAYAVQSGAQSIVSSYNEPLITTEWAVDIFRLAQNNGLRCAYVSNGYATPEVLSYLAPHLDAYKIDLKTMQDRHYRSMGGKLGPVLESIQKAHQLGLWVEIVTLVIPDFNDSPQELWDIARFITSVSRDIPWHVTAFHPDYKMNDRPRTSAASLQQAAEIGQEAGLHYVYTGNLHGRVGSLEDTHCPGCLEKLISRQGYVITEYKITDKGTCPKCSTKIAGIWTNQPDTVQPSSGGLPRLIRW